MAHTGFAPSGLLLRPLLPAAICFPGRRAFTGIEAQGPVDPAMVIERIKEEGLERSDVLAMYTHLTDAIGPRLAGTPAFKEAADWAVDRLEAGDWPMFIWRHGSSAGDGRWRDSPWR